MVMTNAGCSKTHCPAFPAHLVDYYPYHVGDVLKFTNPANDTIAVKIISVETSKENSFGFGCDCACGFSHYFTAEGIDTLKFLIGGGISGSDNSLLMSCRLSDFYNFYDVLYFRKESIYPHAPEVNKILGDTLILEKVDARGFDKAVIVKGEGVIEFFDIENNCIWKKVNE